MEGGGLKKFPFNPFLHLIKKINRYQPVTILINMSVGLRQTIHPDDKDQFFLICIYPHSLYEIKFTSSPRLLHNVKSSLVRAMSSRLHYLLFKLLKLFKLEKLEFYSGSSYACSLADGWKESFLGV